ncbi:MFS transporter [Methylobacterium radiodurans]|uniref:Cyanate transporter n=1 Tax=Methylobacterium radiodurans TaxID=2202828 RepID=A0A2U8VSL5_9HYPH|nr:MFS transporter [Methylobacterium radiodurans]AWN36677.1 cyanate transporter [Methylobacterium radiodurans]
MSVAVRAPHPLLLGCGLMLVAFNLRPALTTVGPLLAAIRAETGLGAAGASVLTTLPVLFLGLACALAPAVGRRLGPDRGILLAAAIVAVGLALRALGGLVPLFAGACIASLGIGLAGVLIPGLVKREFPGRAGLMTGLYTMTLCLGAAAGAGLTVPLQGLFGGDWSLALAAWAAPAVLAALAWAPLARPASPAAPAPAPRRAIWREPLAWQVTGFMGLQSSLAYILFGWVPLVLHDRGLSTVDAGFVAALMSVGQAPAALLVPTVAAKLRDQRGAALAIVGLTAACYLAVAHGPVALLVPATLALGFGLGGCFGLGLTIIVLRARDTRGAAALSAMAQGVGYTIASLGPLGFGLAHEVFGGWGASSLLFCALAAGAAACALGAGRARQVGAA